jgi:hypothetical protein
VMVPPPADTDALDACRLSRRTTTFTGFA